MTGKKSFAHKVRDHPTTNTHHAHPAPDRSNWAAAIMHRWPTWLAIALAALTVGGSTVQSLADVLPMLAFFYVAAAVLQRRQAMWLVAVTIVAGFAALIAGCSEVDPGSLAQSSAAFTASPIFSQGSW